MNHNIFKARISQPNNMKNLTGNIRIDWGRLKNKYMLATTVKGKPGEEYARLFYFESGRYYERYGLKFDQNIEPTPEKLEELKEQQKKEKQTPVKIPKGSIKELLS